MLIMPIYKDCSKEAGASSNKHMVLQECVCFLKYLQSEFKRSKLFLEVLVLLHG